MRNKARKPKLTDTIKMRKPDSVHVVIALLIAAFSALFYVLSNVDPILRVLLSLVVTIVFYHLATHRCQHD